MVGLLRKGIERGELSLVYQPKVSLDAGQFMGVEALARWNEPELGPVSPAEFVPLAEQTNLIRPLTLWVLEEAIRQIAAWKSAGLDVSVSVNLSARNLVDESLPERVEELLARWTVSPASLSFEVTESAMLADPDRAARVLERIRALGITLSIDDFGTGFSSLTYVRTMPASELKIDRSFVQNIESNEGDAAIVRAVIALAHSLGLKVVCEGVETAGALLRLRELGCDLAQGFHVSRPLTAPALVAFVRASLLQPFAPKQARLSVAPPSSRVPPFSRPPLRESLRAIRLGSTPWPASRERG
jgi:EAL domain-containing protein (putative c-di-GMP-specific phosphodiesterase class I)